MSPRYGRHLVHFLAPPYRACSFLSCGAITNWQPSNIEYSIEIKNRNIRLPNYSKTHSPNTNVVFSVVNCLVIKNVRVQNNVFPWFESSIETTEWQQFKNINFWWRNVSLKKRLTSNTVFFIYVNFVSWASLCHFIGPVTNLTVQCTCTWTKTVHVFLCTICLYMYVPDGSIIMHIFSIYFFVKRVKFFDPAKCRTYMTFS